MQNANCNLQTATSFTTATASAIDTNTATAFTTATASTTATATNIASATATAPGTVTTSTTASATVTTDKIDFRPLWKDWGIFKTLYVSFLEIILP